ncbi:MAG: RluA family pseudouridine synthase [Planctomycetota bacterium]|jgi:23S rRNA pseudouridine1911/1915/1917 synthase
MVKYNAERGEEQFFTVPESLSGKRIDAVLTELMPDQSRSYLKKLIDDRLVQVGEQPVKASRKVQAGESITLLLPELVPLEARPEKMPLNILYEDHQLIVINKPPAMVVHPSAGHETGSLVNGLLHHCTDLSGIGGVLRPGIVHRLDRDTSGVMVAAKCDSAHHHLAAQFKNRTTIKIYLCLTHGAPVPPSGEVTGNIGRHPVNRKIMAVLPEGGREANTFYKVLEENGPFSLIECRLGTGRTHQIRLHMLKLGCPILCDATYGREPQMTVADLTRRGQGQAGSEGSRVVIDRQALHAHRLAFDHPASGERMEFEAPLPPDMESALRHLRKG